MVYDNKFMRFTTALAASAPLLVGHGLEQDCAQMYWSIGECPAHHDLGGEGHSNGPLIAPWAPIVSTATTTPGMAPMLR